MLLWIYIFFSLLLSGSLSDNDCPIVTYSGDRRKNKNTLRIMQYNVEWLFIDYYSNANCPGDGCTWKNQSEAEKHMSYVSKAINNLNPDIINLCEVEGCDELNLLKSQLNNNYTPYLKKGTDTATGQNVGMLTQIDPIISLYRTETKYNYPIPGSKCGYNGTISSTSVSKHYITEFVFNKLNIAFISAHLIAMPTDPTRCSQREAQASILQSVIFNYINRNYEVIMIGDFNDYDAEEPDVNNNIPISSVIDILKGSSGEYAGKYVLYSAAENTYKNERYTNWWDSDNNCNTSAQKDYSMIDHVLLTKTIKSHINNVFIYHDYDEYCGKYNSDHYPVIVDLVL
jgi:exonuclease III